MEEQFENKIENEKSNEKLDKIQREKSILFEVRALLNNYPLNIPFSGHNNILSMASDMVIILDLLKHCKSKTKKDDIRELLESELDEIKFAIELKKYYIKYKSSKLNFGRSRIFKKISNIVLNNNDIISNKIQSYILAMPMKGKQNMNLKSAMGLPAASAEEYESSEIKEGQSVEVGQAFKIDEEGEVQLA